MNTENKFKESKNTPNNFYKKLQIAEAKLSEAKKYLFKAKSIIENNEMIIDTYRSMKLSLINTLKSLFSDEKPSILSLRYLELTNDIIPVINKIIRANPSIETLDLEGNLLTDEGVPYLCDIISYCPGKLSTIHLDFNFISSFGAWQILESISERDNKIKSNNYSKINSITLSFNKFLNYNDLYIKAWDFLNQNNFDVSSVIEKKYL